LHIGITTLIFCLCYGIHYLTTVSCMHMMTWATMQTGNHCYMQHSQYTCTFTQRQNHLNDFVVLIVESSRVYSFVLESTCVPLCPRVL
jgi:hypothetical protein